MTNADGRQRTATTIITAAAADAEKQRTVIAQTGDEVSTREVLTALEKKRRARDRYLRRTYGIDLADYERRLEAQEGRCAICRSKPRKQVLAVDHDRITSKVRGLLCYQCNHFLLRGCHEDIVILERAVDYLRASLERPN